MRKKILFTISLVLFSTTVLLICFSGITKNTSNTVSVADSNLIKIHTIELPTVLTFADETVPLQYFDIRESLDKELHVNVYWQSQTIFLIKRANRYFPVIEAILKKNGVPDDFKYLAVAESGLQNVVSPSDAVGFWQFLKPTGKENGLEVNDQVDERYHLEKSTEAACKYLKDAYTIFGSWSMAAASYNAGRPGMIRHIERQKETNYFNLYLNDETARYVFRILAIKIILQDPEKYGFKMNSCDLYPPFKYSEVTVDTAITDIANFATTMGTNYKMLKIFNPWLRDNTLPNAQKKTYSIKIPEKGYREQAISNE